MSFPRPLLESNTLTFIFLMITTVYSWSQSIDQKQSIIQNNNVPELNKLIKGFENELNFVQSQVSAKQNTNVVFKKVQQRDGTVVSLNGLGDDGTLLYYTTHLNSDPRVSRADALYPNGDMELQLSGEGLTVGIWDAGAALTTHQEFDSRVDNSDNSEIDNHTTLVTGAVVSSGVKQKAKGIAFAAKAMTNDWSRDKIEVAQAAAEGLLLSNHSYGIKTDRVPDWYFGAYIKVSQDWDKIMYNAPYYLMVTAAGNAQNSFDNESPMYGKTQDGFDLLLGFATSKNGLVIAGANTDIDRNGTLKNAEVAGYSSFGPTDDGRIKPDLAGDGTLIYSTSANSNSSYSSSMGTSMAAPCVSGALLLLQEYHEELYGEFMKSATLKGLTLHTADDVQENGPDYKMGWGVINTKAAAETIRNKEFSALINELTLVDGESISFSVKANGNEPLSASISWTDPEGNYVNRGDLNANIAALTNDLDIRITKDGSTYFPWKLDPTASSSPAVKGDNHVDPFERIDIPDAKGEYNITISHKGDLVSALQDFSLIVTGVELTPCKLIAPWELGITSSGDLGTTMDWNSTGEETLYEVDLKSEESNTWETHTTWETSFSLDELLLGKKYSARVRSVCSQNLTSEYSEEIHFVFAGEATVIEINTPLQVPQKLSVTAFPNPVVNELQIEAEVSQDAGFSIVSMNGTTQRSGKLKEKINVEDLASGVYVLTIQDYAGIASVKFFKD